MVGADRRAHEHVHCLHPDSARPFSRAGGEAPRAHLHGGQRALQAVGRAEARFAGVRGNYDTKTPCFFSSFFCFFRFFLGIIKLKFYLLLIRFFS